MRTIEKKIQEKFGITRKRFEGGDTFEIFSRIGFHVKEKGKIIKIEIRKIPKIRFFTQTIGEISLLKVGNNSKPI